MDKKTFFLRAMVYSEECIKTPNYETSIWVYHIRCGKIDFSGSFCPAMRIFWKLNKISYDHRIYVGTLAQRESGSEFEIFKIRDYQDQGFEKWNIFLII